MKSLLSFLNDNYNFCVIGETLHECGTYEICQDDITNIKYIDLNGKELMGLPSSFDKLCNIEKIELSNNLIEDIPTAIFSLRKLKDIRINRNCLKEISDRISECIDLECLYAGRNLITSIPDSLSRLKHLTRLHLRNNQIASLPNSFTGLNSLEELDLSENHIERLPENFHSLISLEQLYLSGNKLSLLPTDLFKLSNLKGLALSANRIISLDPRIRNLKSLIYLWIYDNPLKDPPLYIADGGFIKIKAHYNKMYGMISKCFLTGSECSKDINPKENQLFIAYCFSKEANDIIKLAIEPAAKKVRLIPVKAIDHRESIDLMCKICHLIQESKYIIADLSNYDNKSTFNVGFELGIACGLGKKIFLICRQNTNRPTDLGRNEILYFDEINKLKTELISLFVQSIKFRL